MQRPVAAATRVKPHGPGQGHETGVSAQQAGGLPPSGGEAAAGAGGAAGGAFLAGAGGAERDVRPEQHRETL